VLKFPFVLTGYLDAHVCSLLVGFVLSPDFHISYFTRLPHYTHHRFTHHNTAFYGVLWLHLHAVRFTFPFHVTWFLTGARLTLHPDACAGSYCCTPLLLLHHSSRTLRAHTPPGCFMHAHVHWRIFWTHARSTHHAPLRIHWFSSITSFWFGLTHICLLLFTVLPTHHTLHTFYFPTGWTPLPHTFIPLCPHTTSHYTGFLDYLRTSRLQVWSRFLGSLVTSHHALRLRTLVGSGCPGLVTPPLRTFTTTHVGSTVRSACTTVGWFYSSRTRAFPHTFCAHVAGYRFAGSFWVLPVTHWFGLTGYLLHTFMVLVLLHISFLTFGFYSLTPVYVLVIYVTPPSLPTTPRFTFPLPVLPFSWFGPGPQTHSLPDLTGCHTPFWFALVHTHTSHSRLAGSPRFVGLPRFTFHLVAVTHVCSRSLVYYGSLHAFSPRYGYFTLHVADTRSPLDACLVAWTLSLVCGSAAAVLSLPFSRNFAPHATRTRTLPRTLLRRYLPFTLRTCLTCHSCSLPHPGYLPSHVPSHIWLIWFTVTHIHLPPHTLRIHGLSPTHTTFLLVGLNASVPAFFSSDIYYLVPVTLPVVPHELPVPTTGSTTPPRYHTTVYHQ